MSDIGGPLLRVLGEAVRGKGDPNPATVRDAHDLIAGMLESKELRQRSAALNSLAQGISFDARRTSCCALLIIMYSKFDPTVPGPDDGVYLNTTAEFAVLAAPRPGSRWAGHVEAKYSRSAIAEYVKVSPYLAEIVAAFEVLFGIKGVLLA